MSNYTGYGTIVGDTSTDWVSVCGWVTCISTGTWDGATMTWKTKGIDGNEVSIFAGSDNLTEQAYTADHMVNFFFGTNTVIRGAVSGSGTTDLDWQIMSSPINRD